MSTRETIMARGRGAALLLAALGGAILLTGCGDPVVVLGDQPNVMRVVLGVAPDQRPDEATPATSEEITNPRGLVVDGDGVLYAVDERARRILAVFSDGGLETVVDHRNCPVDTDCLNRPAGIALTPDESALVVADPIAGQVFRVALATGHTEVVAGLPGGAAPEIGAEASEVELDHPVGVAVAPDGRILFTEQNGHRVWAVQADGTLAAVAGIGQSGSTGDGGPALDARLFVPGALSLVGDDLYIADRGNHKIRLVDLVTGTISAVAGNGEQGFSGDGGPAIQATLRSPQGLVVSPDEATLYIADTGNNRVRSVNLASGAIRTFAGTGQAEFAGSGLEAGDTNLDAPGHLAVTAQGLLFVGDTGHSLVWRTPVRF